MASIRWNAAKRAEASSAVSGTWVTGESPRSYISLLNVGTGKYLKDPNSPAKYDEPTYFTFCTLKEKTATSITSVYDSQVEKVRSVYTLDGRKVNQENLRPGLYILNGKKVVVK